MKCSEVLNLDDRIKTARKNGEAVALDLTGERPDLWVLSMEEGAFLVDNYPSDFPDLVGRYCIRGVMVRAGIPEQNIAKEVSVMIAGTGQYDEEVFAVNVPASALQDLATQLDA